MADWHEIAIKTDELSREGKIKEYYQMLKSEYDKGTTNPEILWRYSRALYELAQETTDNSVRKPYINEGLDVCKKAVELDGGKDANSQKWMGILTSAQGDFVSTKEKISNAYVIRDHFLKSIELNPNDPTTLHCMGNWCWTVMQIGWMERQAASLLFGTPPTSTVDDCLKYLEASSKAGDSIHNSIMIGDVYKSQKKTDLAKNWYQKAMDLPALSERQKRQHAEAAKKLKSC